MYELIKVTERAYYIDCPSKVGIVRTDATHVVLIDSGNDRDTAKRVKRVLDSEGWILHAIYNTHSHADHIGGNKYLSEVSGCRIYADPFEVASVRHPILEPSLLYGGKPPRELCNKFLLADPSDALPLVPDVLPDCLTAIPLSGHTPGMLGFITDDSAAFIADSLSSPETLLKYTVLYIYDVAGYIDTLRRLPTLNAKYYIPSHAPVTEDITSLAEMNLSSTESVAEVISGIIRTPSSAEDVINAVFSYYGIRMSCQQHSLIGSTVRSYLTYLSSVGRAEARIIDNRMFWCGV